jgi:hypothetical protein
MYFLTGKGNLLFKICSEFLTVTALFQLQVTAILNVTKSSLRSYFMSN